jgi:hypothetical protein
MGTRTIPPVPDRVADPSPPGDPPQPGDPLAALADYLDPPQPGAYIEVDLAPAVAIVAEVRAARQVIAAARDLYDDRLDGTDALERLDRAIEQYDHATDPGRSR